LPNAARRLHVGGRARCNPRHRGRAHRGAARAGRAVRLLPAHLFAIAAVVGLALSDLVRAHGAVWLAAAPMVALVPRRRALGALLVALAGWWWGSTRLDALDRSPLRAEVGRAGRVLAVVTAEPRIGMYEQRVFARVLTFDGRRIDEPAQLELPLGRAP